MLASVLPLLRRARSDSTVAPEGLVAYAGATQSGLQIIGKLNSDNPDYDRMLRLARGDHSALAELYATYGARVHALIRSIVKDRAEADDLLHDVFIAVWRNARRYDPERGKVLAWLLMTARSRAIDRLRSIPRSRTVGLDDSHEAPSDEFAEEFTAGKEQLPEMLAVLNNEERQVLYCGYFEGLSCSEMAKNLGVPVGTIKSRTRSALHKMRTKIEGSQ
jgi:RNA polymerase sigma-70 factor, ECF subfamily